MLHCSKARVSSHFHEKVDEHRSQKVYFSKSSLPGCVSGERRRRVCGGQDEHGRSPHAPWSILCVCVRATKILECKPGENERAAFIYDAGEGALHFARWSNRTRAARCSMRIISSECSTRDSGAVQQQRARARSSAVCM